MDLDIVLALDKLFEILNSSKYLALYKYFVYITNTCTLAAIFASYETRNSSCCWRVIVTLCDNGDPCPIVIETNLPTGAYR